LTLPIYPRKRFGQHWLRDEGVLNTIVATAGLTTPDQVLEIGPGTGNLTVRMLPRVGRLTAVELDRDLCQLLRARIVDPRFCLIEGDILQIGIPDGVNKVVANIPYNITGEILRLVLGTIARPERRFSTIVLLVQREIALRLTSLPGSSNYGALSVRCQYLADCELVREVAPRCFTPPPKVHSAVVKLTPRPYPVLPLHPPTLDRLVKLGFAQKRKMLRNNLQSLAKRDEIIQILEELAIPTQARAEDLTIEQWIKLADRTIDVAPLG